MSQQKCEGTSAPYTTAGAITILALLMTARLVRFASLAYPSSIKQNFPYPGAAC